MATQRIATYVSDIITAVGFRIFRDGSSTITTTSEPKESEVIQWIQEVCEELLTVCIEMSSEVGRTTASISLVDGTASYSDLALLLFAPVIMYDEDGDSFSGWIEKTNSREPLKLVREGEKLNYNPSCESEPEAFYIDGSNNLVFLNTPDASYTAKIPYYPYQTIFTATTDTIPFKRIFDNVIIEAVTLRIQNRDEYDLSFELNWFGYIRDQARKILSIRQNYLTRIVN